jgi:alpha-amylase
MWKRLTWGALFIVCLALPLIGLSRLNGTASFETAEPPRTAFVHLFEWTWSDIAAECETFLGANGFNAVQISPPNEHVVLPEQGYPWWQRYQPVSYKLQSRSGDRAQLADMIRRCHRAGVKIYADAVINHMAGQDQGVGSAGTRFTKYSYPGLYQPSDFHNCRRGITNYNNYNEVTTCQLVGLSDLNTSSPYVQYRLVDYLISLIRLGIDGFRIDAAKHISASDLSTILTKFKGEIDTTPYIYQEVIDPGYEAVKKSEYYNNGNVIEFEYGRLVGAKFLGVDGQTIAQLETLDESWGLTPSDKAVVFIDNHDKQRGHGGGGTYVTYKDGKLYDLANVFMLAFPYGYPQVMSSFEFANSDQGPPSDGKGNTRHVYQTDTANCFSEWKCEHRRQAIASMVKFRNYTASYPHVTNWWSNGNNQIAFGRGDRGFVIINRETTPLTRTFQTSLAAGTYCNVIQSDLAAGSQHCSSEETTVTVDSQGQMTITVAPMDAIALQGDAKLP